MGWYGLDDMAQDRDKWRAFLSTVMKLRVPYNVGKFLNSCTIGLRSVSKQVSNLLHKNMLIESL
jgi:hypothetical protein